eukprot:1219151-Rhodomonas_salina.3
MGPGELGRVDPGVPVGVWRGDCLGVGPLSGVWEGDGRGEGLGMLRRSGLTVPRRRRTLTGRFDRMPGRWNPSWSVEPGSWNPHSSVSGVQYTA